MTRRSEKNVSRDKSLKNEQGNTSSARSEEEISTPSEKNVQEQPVDQSDDRQTGNEDEESNSDLTEDASDDEVEPASHNLPEKTFEATQSFNSDPKSNKLKNNEKHSKKESSPLSSILPGVAVILGVVAIIVYNIPSNTLESSIDVDWRSKVDPENHLSNEHRSVIRASLRSILDKSLSRQDESVSTLLILSSNENTAAQLARCLLTLVNGRAIVNQKSTEIDLRSYSGNKSDLDSDLRSLLDSTKSAQAVLLRDISRIPSEHLLERLRLLFGYCDGENPVIANRLFLLTASSTNENDLRESYKSQLPTEHDFVDALMSRISGHTIYIEHDQKSIC